MNTPILKSVLSRLISLTNERDVVALELAFAQVLFELIPPLNVETNKSVTIYRATDIEQQIFSEIFIGKEPDENAPSFNMKKKLAACFMSSESCTHWQDETHGITLYPLNNSVGHTTAIIAIEPKVCEPNLHETIGMLLQIYQNFTELISDNEHDALTGLLNRKTFELKINKVLSQMHQSAKRKDDKTGKLYFLAIFDIDHFKKVNDEFGHLIGDEVLLMLSQLMTNSFRDTDLIFRFGGEEFLGVFECSNANDIEPMLERFRIKVIGFEFPQIGKVTVSSGYTQLSADDGSSQVIDRADLALYYAKNNGRNRTCHYEQLVADGSLQENKIEGDIELF